MSATNGLTITRTFAAARDQVYAAWTQPTVTGYNGFFDAMAKLLADQQTA